LPWAKQGGGRGGRTVGVEANASIGRKKRIDVSRTQYQDNPKELESLGKNQKKKSWREVEGHV